MFSVDCSEVDIWQIIISNSILHLEVYQCIEDMP